MIIIILFKNISYLKHLMILKHRPTARLYTQIVKQSQKMNVNSYTYQAAVDALNKLQSNADYLRKASLNLTNVHDVKAASKLNDVRKYLTRVGLTLDKLDCLSVIHVSGTKGKGTTCALCESILRNHGYKTGFFSSPHLLEVRERIRIDGKPISKEEFAHQFFEVYNALQMSKDGPDDMPLYFRFLVIMAFQYFLKQKVDVAIVEVGIGGEYDCTNVLRKVPVVGITSLGLDHTDILGQNLEAIAWQKGGIMKEGCQAFTVHQPEEALRVLRNRSVEKNCTLAVIDDNQVIQGSNNGVPKEVFNKNVGLARAMANAWIQICGDGKGGLPELSPDITQRAIANCIWTGRFDVRQIKNIKYFLDGAHTLDSISICKNWFNDMTKVSSNKKVLLFNITGKRDPIAVLSELIHCHFHFVLFVGNVSGKSTDIDRTSFATSQQDMLERCRQHKTIWLRLQDREDTIHKAEKVEVYPTVLEAIESLGVTVSYSLLVTGSVHLVGCVLALIDPLINSSDYNGNMKSVNNL